MRIGELAEKAGVSVRALRYYEEQHLLTSERSPSGQRHYRQDAVEQVQLIQQLYQSGLPSKSIAEILPCITDGPLAPHVLQRLESERERLDRQITGLIATRDRLDASIAHAAQGHPCRLGASPAAAS